MRKVLIGLGSAAVAVAPITMAVSCGSEETISLGVHYNPTTKIMNISHFDSPEIGEDGEGLSDYHSYLEIIVDVISDEKYADATEIIITGEHGGVTLVPSLNCLVGEVQVGASGFSTLADLFDHDWATILDDSAGDLHVKVAPLHHLIEVGFQPIMGEVNPQHVLDAFGGFANISSTIHYYDAELLSPPTSIEDMIEDFELVGITVEDVKDAFLANDAEEGDWLFLRSDPVIFNTILSHTGIEIDFEHKTEPANVHTAQLDVDWAIQEEPGK